MSGIRKGIERADPRSRVVIPVTPLESGKELKVEYLVGDSLHEPAVPGIRKGIESPGTPAAPAASPFACLESGKELKAVWEEALQIIP